MITRLTRHIDALSRPQLLAYLMTAFICVHAAVYAAGVRFFDATLIHFMHFLDPDLLRERYLECIWYLHIQPPLFNAFLGAVFKIAGEYSTAVFHTIYVCLGFALTLGLFVLQRVLGVTRTLALATTLVFLVSPSFLLYEHWLFYTFPCAVMIVYQALLVYAADGGRRRWAVWAFFGLVAVLCATRSMFHLTYYLAIALGILLVWRAHLRHCLIAASVPFLLLFASYAKNYVLFDTLTLSSWSGKNLWIKSVGNMAWEERRRHLDEGTLSEVSLLARYNELGYYDPEYMDPGRFAGIPALAERWKATGGINYNHVGYIPVSKAYAQDAMRGIALSPKTFALSTIQSGLLYLAASTDYDFAHPNRLALQPWTRVYDMVVYGRLPVNLSRWHRVFPVGATQGYRPCILLLVGVPMLLTFGSTVTARGRFCGHALPSSARILVGLCLFNATFVLAVTVVFEMVETNRIRFMTDPIFVVFMGLLLQSLIDRSEARDCERE